MIILLEAAKPYLFVQATFCQLCLYLFLSLVYLRGRYWHYADIKNNREQAS